MTVIIVLFYLTMGLLGLKLLWNALTPVALAWEVMRGKRVKSSGISMALIVEILLFPLLILLSWLGGGGTGHWYSDTRDVVLWGLGAIVGSYLIFYILGMLSGWWLSMVKKRRPGP